MRYVLQMTAVLMVAGLLAQAAPAVAGDGGLETQVRRVVTGHDSDGSSVFVKDGEPPRVVTLNGLPGFEFIEVWATEETPRIPVERSEPTIAMSSFVPAAGGSRFRIVRFPPDSEAFGLMEEGLGMDEVLREAQQKIPGLAETLEADAPGMHTTDTVDYGIVLSGAISLELDDGATVELQAGDVVVQQGTRHAWHNRGEEDCVMAFVMVGAQPADAAEDAAAAGEEASSTAGQGSLGRVYVSPTSRGTAAPRPEGKATEKD